MFSQLWDLIRDEAEAVEGYFKVLHEAKEDPETQVLVPILEDIIADEQDHIDALTYAYNSMGGVKSKADVLSLAKKEFSRLRATRIYKESLKGEE